MSDPTPRPEVVLKTVCRSDCLPASDHCFVETALVGCGTTLKPIISVGFYVVTRVSQESVTLRDEGIAEIGEFEVTIHQLAKHTKLRHALTLYSVQGRSLTGTITIHDVTSTHFKSEYLYVGLSRATQGRDVSIERS